jgi:Tfp pilus assembly protein PilO
MVENIVRTIVEHPRRKVLVIILTLVTGVMFGLFAVEEYSAAHARMSGARQKLDEASGTAANLPQMRTALDRTQREVQELERKAITQKDLEHLRDGELQKLIRETGCEMRQMSIDEVPMKRDWRSNDSPLRGTPIGDAGQPTPFVLMQWNARLQIEGRSHSIYKFLERISQMDRFIQARSVQMQRSETNENMTQLRMEITLFDLARKKSGKDGA